MTVREFILRYSLDTFCIVTFENWSVSILYDSRKTKYDVPMMLSDSLVESVNVKHNGMVEIEI